MDYKYIEQLLCRYFEAETTLKEEQILKAFFTQDDGDMPASLCQYKELFAAMEQSDVLTSDFDKRILKLISEPVASETPEIPAAPAAPETVKAREISLSERLRPLFRAAAAVAIFLTMSTAINQSFKSDNVWTDEDQIAEYQKALRDATLAATTDSTLLYTEGIAVKTDSIVAGNDSLFTTTTGYLE